MKKLIPSLMVLAAIPVAVSYFLPHIRRPAAPAALRVSGNIEAHESDLSFKVQGRIKELAVHEGQWVGAGTLLARLDDDDYRQEVAVNESNWKLRNAQLALTEAGSRIQDIKAAEQSVADAHAELELRKIDYRRKQALYSKDAISAETLDIVRTNMERAQATYERAKELYAEVKEGSRQEQIAVDRQAVVQAWEDVRLSRIKLGYTVLRAPTSGVIVTREAELGEVVGPGTPIVTLAEVDHPWLRAYVNETDLGRVRWGEPATITTDTYPGKKYQGTVSFIASDAEFTPKSVQTQAERVTLVYRIKIDIPNPNHQLKPGMPADAVLQPDVSRTEASSASPGTTASPPPPPLPPVLRRAQGGPTNLEPQSIKMREDQKGTEIEISGIGAVRAKSMRLRDPERIVVDLPNTIWRYAPRLLPSQASDVKSIRIAQHRADPPVTRVVVDMNGPRSYELVSGSSGLRVVLHSMPARQ